MSSQQDEAATPDGAPGGARFTAASQAGTGQSRVTAETGLTAGKVTAGGKVRYRRLTPIVFWWVWVAFVVLNLADIVIPEHSYFSVELTAGLLTVTAVVYACTLRPRVLADEHAVLIQNPFRDHQLGWGAIKGVFLGDSVEFTCARPAPKKDKVLYCWALYTARLPRMRAQMQRSLVTPWRSNRIPSEAADLQRKDTVELMAAELGHRCKQARDRGVPDAVLESRWAWLPVAGTVALAVATLALILAR